MPEARNIPNAEYIRAFDTLERLVGMLEAASLQTGRSKHDDKLSVVIVTGFLGAGKTTLMRHLLTARHGLKIAAIVNDFAALNIDAALIAEVSEDTTMLANGCICCSLTGNVARSLFAIASRETPVDAVLIEASGVSDPAGIAQVAAAVDGITIDCIVTVVDAAENSETAESEFLLERQVAPASLVLLNKTDLIPQPDADALAQRLSALAPKAQVLRTVQCAVPPVVIFEGVRTPAFWSIVDASPRQEHGFTTLVLESRRPVQRRDMDRLLQEMPEGIVRIKGFVMLADSTESVFLLQVVGKRWSWQPAPKTYPGCKLVIIGRSKVMDEASVRQHFASLGFEDNALAD